MTTPGSSRYAKAVSDLQRNADALLLANTEFNATRSRQDELQTSIDTRFSDNPDDPEIPRLARELATGKLLRAERLRQEALMPPIDPASAHPEAKRLWSEIAIERANMARYKIRMDVNGSDPDKWAHWRDKHVTAATCAEIATAEFTAVQANGPGAWGHMTHKQRAEARTIVAEGSDFTTPSAPQPLEEVFHDYVDRETGQSPAMPPELIKHAAKTAPAPDLDSVSWAEQRAHRNAPTAAAGRSPGSPRFSASRARMRRARMGSSRRHLQELRRAAVSADSQRLQSLSKPAPGQGDDPDKLAASDPTGLLFLLSLFSGRR